MSHVQPPYKKHLRLAFYICRLVLIFVSLPPQLLIYLTRALTSSTFGR